MDSSEQPGAALTGPIVAQGFLQYLMQGQSYYNTYVAVLAEICLQE